MQTTKPAAIDMLQVRGQLATYTLVQGKWPQVNPATQLVHPLIMTRQGCCLITLTSRHQTRSHLHFPRRDKERLHGKLGQCTEHRNNVRLADEERCIVTRVSRWLGVGEGVGTIKGSCVKPEQQCIGTSRLGTLSGLNWQQIVACKVQSANRAAHLRRTCEFPCKA